MLSGLLVTLKPWLAPDGELRLLRTAAHLLALGEIGPAEKTANEVLRDNPRSAPALLIAGQAAGWRKRPRLAVEYFSRIPDDGGREAVLGWYGSAQQLLELGRVTDAEKLLRRAVEHDPQFVDARFLLYRILEFEGRIWEARGHLLPLIRSGRFSGYLLLRFLQLALLDGPPVEADLSPRRQFVERARAATPDDPLPGWGLAARLFIEVEQYDEAALWYRSILKAHPELCAAHAQLGVALLKGGHEAELSQWHRRLPPAADEHPAVWYTRGQWAERRGARRAAARCYWEAIRRDPDHRRANYRLSQALSSLGRQNDARPFAERARLLSAVQVRAGNMKMTVYDEKVFQDAAEVLEELGRDWEAAAWYYFLTIERPEIEWAWDGLARLRRRVVTNEVLTPDGYNPARHVDLSAWPLPDFSGSADSPGSESPGTGANESIAYSDEAKNIGLDFQYHNGGDPSDDKVYMFEFSGGGVAVLDYDSDGRPDIYLTQGAPWPIEHPDPRYRDRLFRQTVSRGTNRQSALPAAVDVTDAAGLGDGLLTHGVAAGDFDGDGFTDLYVGNLGPNVLYLNNGDGTFSEVGGADRQTVQAVRGGEQEWTSGAVMADLNGDGLPEIYVVNYLAPPKIFTKFCTDDEHRPGHCPPAMYDAMQDRLLLNLGDGRLRDITEASGIVQPDGKGLGIVAADFDGSRRLSLFVANDTTPNFFFVNVTGRPAAGEGAALVPRFDQRGLLQGVALGRDGQAQACMGVAVDDADGNHRLDLFVTNFAMQANNFFVQRDDRLFSDEIERSNLYRAGFNPMGWGAQFTDPDLDGRPDLIVANGHLLPYAPESQPDRSEPHFFSNSGGGRFTRLAAESLGPYFEGKYLGRAVALLDWNGDGREDCCVTHADVPVSLLINRTQRAGRWLAVRLRGTASAREPIGTTVRIRAGELTRTRQLTAGDGFMASNERLLIFGLGAAGRIDELTIEWPSGRDQTFRDVGANRELLFIEGAEAPRELRRDRPQEASTGLATTKR